MDTIPEHEVRGLRVILRALAVLSAFVHCALAVYSVLKAVQALGAAPVYGFALLAALFVFSCAAQCFYAYTTFREQALETFRQPCLVRSAEFAALAPLHVALVASCVLVRDAQTLGLLAAAQTACVLVAFALEYVLATYDIEDARDKTVLATAQPELALPIELSIGTIVRGPALDERFVCTHAQTAARAWHVCFCAALQLHVAVWAVLANQLLASEAAVCATARDAGACQTQLRLLVGGQCALFSCFALVPLLQWSWMWAGEADASAAFLYGSVLYAVLSLVAKSLLAASYVAFVELFPYA